MAGDLSRQVCAREGCRNRVPLVAWRAGDQHCSTGCFGYACRLCIGRLGFKAEDFLPMTVEEHAAHLVEVHPEAFANQPAPEGGPGCPAPRAAGHKTPPSS